MSLIATNSITLPASLVSFNLTTQVLFCDEIKPPKTSKNSKVAYLKEEFIC
ncbi:MAG: hypothetical protein IPG08_04015 [Sphingobacteriaceae bacterium]|nr:hypothetical protein [Sphingobacteriaceae bacterium]